MTTMNLPHTTASNGITGLPSPGEVVLVTPDIAAEWLTHNTHNRNAKPTNIKKFAEDMTNGEWQWTGEPIRFAVDGTLLDGQNRLYAIIESGVTIPLLVIRGLPREAQDAIDTGAARKLHDILKLRGEANASALAALLRITVAWELGMRRASNHNAIPHSRCIHFLDDHPELRELLTPSRSVADSSGLPASVVGLVWWVTSQIDAEDAEFFFRRLGDGQGLVKGDPIYELRRTVQESRNVRGERNRTWLLAITIKAWNSYRKGEKVGLFRWRPGGANPEKFPEPV